MVIAKCEVLQSRPKRIFAGEKVQIGGLSSRHSTAAEHTTPPNHPVPVPITVPVPLPPSLPTRIHIYPYIYMLYLKGNWVFLIFSIILESHIIRIYFENICHLYID